MSKKVYVDRVLKNAYQHHTKAIEKSIEYYSDPDHFTQDEFSEKAIWHLQWLKKVVREFTVDIEEWGEVPILDETYYEKQEKVNG